MDNTADVFDGKVYSVAGIDGALSFLDDLFVYDPAADTWTQLASLSIAREKPAAAFVDGLLYVTGGWDSLGGNVSALEIYDPATDTWSAGADVPAAYAAAATVCPGRAAVPDRWLHVDLWLHRRVGLRPGRRHVVAGGALSGADVVGRVRRHRRADLLRWRRQRFGRRERQRVRLRPGRR